jgi:hypothetical protein
VQISAGDSNKRFLSFPAVALRPGGYVWTIVDEKLKKVPVDIVDRTKIKVEDELKNIIVIRQTEDSLQPNDRIVVSPIPQAVDGLKVQTGDEQATKKVSLKKEEPPAA